MRRKQLHAMAESTLSPPLPHAPRRNCVINSMIASWTAQYKESAKAGKVNYYSACHTYFLSLKLFFGGWHLEKVIKYLLYRCENQRLYRIPFYVRGYLPGLDVYRTCAGIPISPFFKLFLLQVLENITIENKLRT